MVGKKEGKEVSSALVRKSSTRPARSTTSEFQLHQLDTKRKKEYSQSLEGLRRSDFVHEMSLERRKTRKGKEGRAAVSKARFNLALYHLWRPKLASSRE